jgi:K+-transporting ATPase ATPase C chain
VRTLPSQLLASVRALLVMTLVLGLLYPLLVWAVGQAAFPRTADGSLVRVDGRVVGSTLIGQSFTDASGAPLPQYFQSRPSAAGTGYDPTSTAASNLGPDSATLLEDVCARSAAVGASDGVSGARQGCGGATGSGAPAVPPDAVTASGSGLDPHISPAYAAIQVQRVATARGIPAERVRALVAAHTQGRTLGFLGEPRVDVLQLNLALAALR